MSFTGEIKVEICESNMEEAEMITELSAIVNNSEVSSTLIKINSENNYVVRYIFSLIKSVCTLTPMITVRRGYNYNKRYIYILEINNNVIKTLEKLGIYSGGKILDTPEEFIFDDDSLMKAYLKGLFLMTGSINDPKKSGYHLEFFVSDFKYAKFVQNLLNRYDLNSKIIRRETKYMIYVKEAEKIADFLRIVNVPRNLLYFEDIRIYRDHKNMTNRLNNCEQANVDKTIMTASKQAKNIEKILSIGGMDLLSEKEQIVANYRLKYREASLSELSEIISLETNIPITKSGINHRMKKITDLANRIK